MIGLGEITLLRPAWLVALPLIALAAVVLGRRAATLAAWERAVDPALLAALERLGRVIPGRGWSPLLPALTAGLVALALAGPARERADGTSFRNLDGLVVAVDLSASMAEGGRLPEALIAARMVAEGAGTRPVALVVYAGDAYLGSGFTTDARSLGTTIAVLDGETVPDTGSRPDRALALARRTLAEAKIIAGDVVLISDGGGIDARALDETRAITAAGGRVSTIHVPPLLQPAAMPRGERSVLDAVAALGGGAAADVLDAGPVAGLMAEPRGLRLAENGFAAVVWQDFGRWLLLPALLPAFLLFRRRA